MGGDHGHGHGMPKLPDWKVYKIENVPELMKNKKTLAEMGLKDPWARNEVWKYKYYSKYSKWQILNKVGGRGMKWGFLAALVTTAIGYALPDEHGHGDGHGDGHGHGH